MHDILRKSDIFFGFVIFGTGLTNSCFHNDRYSDWLRLSIIIVERGAAKCGEHSRLNMSIPSIGSVDFVEDSKAMVLYQSTTKYLITKRDDVFSLPNRIGF